MSYLHVRLVEAIGLPSTDLLGFVDPYCKVHLQNVTHLSENKVFKSEAKKKSTDPIFDCAASLNVSPKDFDNGMLRIDIYDRDKARQTDEQLGVASLPLAYFKSNQQFQGWLPVRSPTKLSKSPQPVSARDRQRSEWDKDKILNKEMSPELQLLNGSGDMNAPPPRFPPHVSSSQSSDAIKKKRHIDPYGPPETLTATNSITPEVSVRLAATSPNLHHKNETKKDNKQKQLAKMSEDFMKKQIARAETLAQLDDPSNNTNESSIITKAATVDVTQLNHGYSHEEAENKTQQGANTMQHGRRNRDSGRIFIVVHYQNQFHFGKMSNDEIKKTRIKNLKISNEFCASVPLNVFTLTFNAGNCNLSDFDASLPEWLPSTGSIDLYALGFQELNQTKHATEEHKEAIDDVSQQQEIETYFLNHLGKGGDYVTVSHYKMWQTRLFVFTKKEYAERISNVTTHFHSTGIGGGVVRNKGGVAISLAFDGVSLCFVSCHLAAHQTKSKERNAMYKKLCKNVKVGWPKQPLLGQFHFLFFMGDMNYRVNYFGQAQADKPSEELFQQVCQIIKEITIQSSKQQQADRIKHVDQKQITGGGHLVMQNAFSGLLKHDQLTLAKETRKAFVDFHEHHMKFPPSFKVKRQVGIHYIAQRLPAWCDRILWRCRSSFDEGKEYKVKNYRIYDKVSVSDHKPVSCSFVLPTWPRPCAISDDCTKSIVHFRNMSAQNLIPADVNGYSDPFLHFPRQLLLEKYVQSKRVNKTLNPQWKNKHLKPLILIRNSLPFLQKALLLFQVRDHDKFSADDLIGCGCIELKYVVEKLNKWIKFEQRLTLSGRDAGVLKGEIKLEYKVKKSKISKNNGDIL
eukprot:570059_1